MTTECDCGKQGKHYSEKLLDIILPGIPDTIHQILFQSENGFMNEFRIMNQKLTGTFGCIFLNVCINESIMQILK